MEGALLKLFPKEIWTIIFQSLDDYDDVRNLAEAFPEMEPILIKVNCLGLFEQAIPHVAEWLSVTTLLRCRLICKQWARGVDLFLENLLSPPTTHEPTMMMRFLKSRSKCAVGRRRHSNHPAYFRQYFNQTNSFPDGLRLEKFFRKMEGHPADRNPFVGRVVNLDLELGTDCKDILGLGYWEEARRLLREWGTHIWYFELRLGHSYPRQSCQYLKESLWLLPNLRALTLEGHTPWYFEVMDTKWKQNLGLDDAESFPKLQSLLTFNSSYRGMPQLGDTLMTQYSAQLSRLQISLEDDWTWSWTWKEEKYASLLPNLTELEVRSELEKNSTSRLKEKINKILLSINTPKLQHLLLTGYWSNADSKCPEYVFGKEEVIQWMRRFPYLSYLHLPQGLVSVVEECAESSNSVKILSLHISNIKFSLHFPEVQFLHIYLSRGPPDKGTLAAFRKVVNKTELLQVWNHCPELKKLYIEDLGTGAWKQLQH